jgi:hypothetical protein
MGTRAGTAAALLAYALIAGCGGSEAPQDEEAARAKGRDTDKTVFDDMIQTEDRARAVEKTTMDAKAATDAAIEAQTGGDAPEESGN